MRLARILFVILLLSGKIVAQISISHPLNNAVYQRTNSNVASIFVSGTYSQSNITSIEARLINPDSEIPLVSFDWTIIGVNPNAGIFQWTFNNVPSGWHKLQIRSKKGGVIVETAELNRFGIGDVFVIAGQSNAQGGFSSVNLGSSNPKVVTHNNGMYCSPLDIPYPVFSQLLDNTKPGTNGRDAWCYGRLGENIINTTGYPVAIFNSAASGSSVGNWEGSSNGNVVLNPLGGNEAFCSTSGENNDNPTYVSGNPSTYANTNPYAVFKKSLQYYNSMFGVRSVLWHQGESDNAIFNSSTNYTNSLNYVINKSRADFGSTLPWVISRVSYFFVNGFDSNIISGQNNVINPSNQVFAGPNTDGINNSSIPGSRDYLDLHFNGTVGMTALSDAWSNSLNSGFFSSSQPISAKLPPIITSNFLNSSQISLSVPSGYGFYKWIRTDLVGNSNFSNTSIGNSNTITVTSGKYRCWVTDATGNLQVSAEIDATNAFALASNGLTCTSNQYLSDLKIASSLNGMGPIELNKTNGTSLDGDGNTIVLKGITYPKGLGVSANSEINYFIPSGQYYRFKAQIGIGDEITNCNNTGGVIFKVYGNGSTLLYTSPTIYRNSPIQEVNINIFNYSSLKLKVEEVGNSISCNKAVWADAKLMCMLGDTTPPTTPTNLVVSDTLTKCLSFQWTHSTDDQQLAGYYLLKNGVLIDTIPNNQNTFTMTGLTSGNIIKFGVIAFDVLNNISDTANIVFTVPSLQIVYLGEDYFCTSRSYLPTVLIPGGGTFTKISGPIGTIVPTTGEFYSTNVGLFLCNYQIGNGNPVCSQNSNFYLGTVSPPTNTPTVTTDKTIINQGSVVSFSSSSCDNPSTLVWSFIGGSSSNINYSPTSTGVYYSACKKNLCYNYSNVVQVKVIPNCGSAVSLVSGTDNLNSNINSLNFRSSNTISASNQIIPTNNVQYNAANSITLNPGFKVDSGVIFSAKIQNCP
jgi:NPCBM/NEW2 domain/Carbohydrate esterase, sialic acid-specific acetylesterase